MAVPLKKQAEQIWHNCIHKNIGSFTLSQEQRAIKDIEKYLRESRKAAVLDVKKQIERGISFQVVNLKNTDPYIRQKAIGKKKAYEKTSQIIDSVFFGDEKED